MTVDELGEIKREFKPSPANLVAGIIIGVLLIGGGGALAAYAGKATIENRGNLPFWAEKDWSWGAAGLLGILGIGLLLGGVFLMLWVRSLFSLRVRIGQNGFSVTQKRNTQVHAWDDILSVQETHLYQRPPLLKGVAKYALPKCVSKHFAVQIKEREAFIFDADSIKGHVKLAHMIKEETDKRNVPWEVVEEHE